MRKKQREDEHSSQRKTKFIDCGERNPVWLENRDVRGRRWAQSKRGKGQDETTKGLIEHTWLLCEAWMTD